MQYLAIILIVLIMAAASCCDGPTAHITAAVKNAETTCYTSLDSYNHVSLIAAQKKGGK